MAVGVRRVGGACWPTGSNLARCGLIWLHWVCDVAGYPTITIFGMCRAIHVISINEYEHSFNCSLATLLLLSLLLMRSALNDIQPL